MKRALVFTAAMSFCSSANAMYITIVKDTYDNGGKYLGQDAGVIFDQSRAYNPCEPIGTDCWVRQEQRGDKTAVLPDYQLDYQSGFPSNIEYGFTSGYPQSEVARIPGLDESEQPKPVFDISDDVFFTKFTASESVSRDVVWRDIPDESTPDPFDTVRRPFKQVNLNLTADFVRGIGSSDKILRYTFLLFSDLLKIPDCSSPVYIQGVLTCAFDTLTVINQIQTYDTAILDLYPMVGNPFADLVALSGMAYGLEDGDGLADVGPDDFSFITTFSIPLPTDDDYSDWFKTYESRALGKGGDWNRLVLGATLMLSPGTTWSSEVNHSLEFYIPTQVPLPPAFGLLFAAVGALGLWGHRRAKRA